MPRYTVLDLRRKYSQDSTDSITTDGSLSIVGHMGVSARSRAWDQIGELLDVVAGAQLCRKP